MKSKLTEGWLRYTTAPLEAGVWQGPEFVDTPGAKQWFGLSKSLLFRLHAEGKIDGVAIRQPGKVRGKRLWVAQSIRNYLLANIAPAEWNPRKIANERQKRKEVTSGIAS